MVSKMPDNRVTTQGYWDSVWSPLSGREGRLIAADYYFGQRGVFSKLVKDRLGDIAGKSVLEFGGGGNNFRLLAMAKWLGAEVTALDFSDEGLAVVKEMFRVNGCDASFIKQDICEWLPTEQYDFIVHWGVLEHFVDPMPILLKSAAALKPGGSLLFSMPNMEAIAAKLWKKWSPDNWSKHIFHPADLINSQLSEIGFCNIESFYFGVPFVKISDWEVKSIAQYPVDLMQKFSSASARVLPAMYRMGHRLVSMERGFYARKRE